MTAKRINAIAINTDACMEKQVYQQMRSENSSLCKVGNNPWLRTTLRWGLRRAPDVWRHFANPFFAAMSDVDGTRRWRQRLIRINSPPVLSSSLSKMFALSHSLDYTAVHCLNVWELFTTFCLFYGKICHTVFRESYLCILIHNTTDIHAEESTEARSKDSNLWKLRRQNKIK